MLTNYQEYHTLPARSMYVFFSSCRCGIMYDDFQPELPFLVESRINNVTNRALLIFELIQAYLFKLTLVVYLDIEIKYY